MRICFVALTKRFERNLTNHNNISRIQSLKDTILQNYKVTRLQENNLEKFKINTGL